MIYIIALTVIVGALGLYYYVFKYLNFFKKHDIPHKKPLPILGNMGAVMFRRQSFPEFINNCYNVHPEAKYVGMFEMTNPVVVIRDPELIKSIALKNFDIFPDH